MKKKIINILRGFLNFSLAFICETIAVIGCISISPLALLALIPTLYFAVNVVPATGQYIKNSIFQVHMKHKINQNALSKPVRALSCMLSKNKGEKVTEEAINLFKELDKCDYKGRPIEYKTVSQSKTKYLLKLAERDGYIEDFKCEPSKCKNLVLEKIIVGNYKMVLKKEKMYKMSFILTDKEIKEEDIKRLKYII